MKRTLLATALLISFSPLAHAKCVLRKETMGNDPTCTGAVGYADGARVGWFNWRGAAVAFGGKCQPHRTHGKLVNSDTVFVDGRARKLTDDCRSTF
ncbi:hypothetical protein [Bradyrhizobium sp. SYSU BS000235]|uniref:hypothetical protein n=1 Tax=Bradyrhizobium sp. SYSU BS000235 TaxID=3411332 RepID=UPI003C74B7B4